MNADTISLIGGTLLSLVLEYVPGLKNLYGKYDKTQKRAMMALLLFVVMFAAYGLSCAGWLEGLWPGLAVTCDQAGWQVLIRSYILALVANQGTHGLYKRTTLG